MLKSWEQFVSAGARGFLEMDTDPRIREQSLITDPLSA